MSRLTRSVSSIGDKIPNPFKPWHDLRQRLHHLIWPTEEEARRYQGLLQEMLGADWYKRGQADAMTPTREFLPPHTNCPCNLCRKYWEGFWSRSGISR